MNGVLILAHGSREKETEATLNTVAEMVRERFPEHIIATAYMEFAQPNIEAGLNLLIEKGAERVMVIPYFLFDGIHIKRDIPEELDKFRATHPGVKIAMASTLGADSRLADILAERISGAL